MSVLVKPKISEKSGYLSTLGKYVFEVAANASAPEVRKEVEKLYKVKVASVNMVNTRGKSRRYGRTSGRTSNKRKAIVTLVPGQTIEGMTAE